MSFSTTAFADTAIVSYGVSEQLQGDFDMLRETTFCATHSQAKSNSIHNDVQKFSSKSVDKLAQQLICRNYGSSCYELAHLCWAILHSSHKPDTALMEFFWLETVCTKTSFIAYFNAHTTANGKALNSNISASSIALVQNDLHISIHQHSFIVHCARANYLSCLMEWLACSIPNTLAMLFELLLGQGHNAISEAASALQQDIYQYLTEHLPPAKLQKRYRLLDTWYKTQASDIDDDEILKFFQQHKQIEGCGKYTNVVNDTFCYMQALEDAATLQQVKYSAQIEAYSDAIVQVLEQHDSAYDGTWRQLAKLPKVFSQTQCDMGLLIMTFSAYFPSFSKTWLRSQAFGKWQSQLIQACRDNKPLSLAKNSVDSYESLQQALALVLANSYQAQLAMLHNLFKQAASCEHQAGTTYVQIAALLVQLKTSHPLIKQYEKDIKAFAEQLASQQQHTKIVLANFPTINTIASTCSKAYKQINRAGFTAATCLSDEQYYEHIQNILLIQSKLHGVLKLITRNKYCEEAIFKADRFIFESEFTQLYIQDGQ